MTVRRPFHRKDSKWKKYGGTELLSKKSKALHAHLNETVEPANSSSCAAVDFLQYIYSVLVVKNY